MFRVSRGMLLAASGAFVVLTLGLMSGRAHLAERGGPGTSVESGVRDER